ncbi:TPA: hypothetical protein ACH3X1_005423 [Trebouxia sp. C0004]
MQSLAKWSRSVYIQQKCMQPSGILLGQQRWLASHRGGGRNNRDDDPTLGDIGSTMLNKIKELPGTVYQGFTKLANRLISGRWSPPESARPQHRSKQRSPISGLFGSGLMGAIVERTLGRAIEGIAKGAAEHLQATQERTEELQQAASQAIKANSQLRQDLGADLQVAMVFPVVASNGRTAHAHVQTSQSVGLDIQVQLPNGEVIRVDPKQRQENDYLEQDEDDFGPKGRVIDADWREVR